MRSFPGCLKCPQINGPVFRVLVFLEQSRVIRLELISIDIRFLALNQMYSPPVESDLSWISSEMPNDLRLLLIEHLFSLVEHPLDIVIFAHEASQPIVVHCLDISRGRSLRAVQRVSLALDAIDAEARANECDRISPDSAKRWPQRRTVQVQVIELC